MFKNTIVIFFLTFLSSVTVMAGNPHDLVIDYTTNDEPCMNCHTTPELATSTISCLGCHDGVIATNVAVNIPGAIDYFPTINYTNNTDTALIVTSNLPGTNTLDGMRHPISIFYDENFESLRTKSNVIFEWDSASTINDLLIEDKIECVSCHNPHNKVLPTYLRRSNYKSELCKSCHTN